MADRCTCPAARPITVATFRSGVLTTVIRHHIRPCPVPEEELDRVNWQPRNPDTTLAHTLAATDRSRR